MPFRVKAMTSSGFLLLGPHHLGLCEKSVRDTP